ncbi:helix-turn-helix domain-containing protein [Streptomyces sp. TRM43335]|uniref:Helix-turn-helix domain-containing protein n=1 Tax=Streptomyces taklimakanensis TaxID=2569853 RepID=A0A6G2B6R9_9ACTN|nr:helix-turn-helix transcriptional regulator [Streptomyces taklimakanensis]MTE17950.1 helix-turn-helix domain-containing protein [Streptomyces taklimakanensis]
MAAESSRPLSIRRYIEHPKGSPTVLRLVIGSQLRRLRKERGIDLEEAAKAIRGSSAKISRLERGQGACKERDVADLLTLYGVLDEEERADFLALTRQTATRGWWHRYSDVLPGWFDRHIGLEEAAAVIRVYEVQFVPGLLQTEDYARAVILLGHPRASVHENDRRVRLRMDRQELLTRPDAPRLWAVLDEAALRRPLGDTEVMRGQLRHLIDMARRPNVTLQVAPFSVGGLAAAGGPVTILRFPEPDLPDVVYLEQLTSALYLDKEEDVDHYLSIMDRLCAVAETPVSSVAFLERLLDELG